MITDLEMRDYHGPSRWPKCGRRVPVRGREKETVTGRGSLASRGKEFKCELIGFKVQQVYLAE